MITSTVAATCQSETSPSSDIAPSTPGQDQRRRRSAPSQRVIPANQPLGLRIVVDDRQVRPLRRLFGLEPGDGLGSRRRWRRSTCRSSACWPVMMRPSDSASVSGRGMARRSATISTNHSKLSSTSVLQRGARRAGQRFVEIRLGLQRPGLHLVRGRAPTVSRSFAGIDVLVAARRSSRRSTAGGQRCGRCRWRSCRRPRRRAR